MTTLQVEELIIVLSAGLSGVVVVLIAAAVIVISVTVCLRKRNNKHVNISAYATSRNEIELSACDDVANQPSSGQLKMKNNTETRASDSNYTDDVYAYATPPTTAILTSNMSTLLLMLCMTSPLPLEIEKQNLIFPPLLMKHMMLLVKQENMKWLYL